MGADTPKKLAVLGSTGSIGCSTLDVARRLTHIQIHSLSGHRNLELLSAQSREFCPQQIVVADAKEITATQRWVWGAPLQFGPEALVAAASDPAVDMVVAAIVGQAGLASTLAAAASGKRVALANKESLVVAGELLTATAVANGGELIPVDSEHSAIFQACRGGRKSEIRRVILTASGGPFLNHSAADLARVTVSDALRHPKWQMGQKITIDSATMMNKALEVIEARWLFGLDPDQIQVMIHPQSIIHSMVEFCDGSILAQLSPPDMRLPIQYALTYPDRVPGPAQTLDWSARWNLELLPVNNVQQAALDLGFWVCRHGGTSGAVLNAANEVAVAAFLQERLPFNEIVPRCREILEQHRPLSQPTYEDLLAADTWARQEMNQWIFA